MVHKKLVKKTPPLNTFEWVPTQLLPLAPGPQWYDGRWPQERSDMEPSPRVKYVRLSNGFRVALINNARPNNRVSFQLNVQVGAFMERPDEYGFAHLIEHMAFRQQYPEFGERSTVEQLQEWGMEFGNDANAYTDVSETVYSLNVPLHTEDSPWENACHFLSLIAGHMRFTEEDVERECAVVLAEKMETEGVDEKLDQEWLEFLYPKSPFSTNVIGTQASIASASAQKLSRFYHKWYRPERMVLVVTGPIDEAALLAAVEKTLGAIAQPDFPLSYVQDFGQEPEPGLKILSQTREGTRVSLIYTVLHRGGYRADTRYNERGDVQCLLTRIAAERRLDQLAEINPQLWSQASFDNVWRKGFTPNVTLKLDSTLGFVDEALRVLADFVTELEFKGITQEELDWAKKATLKSLRTEIVEFKNADNEEIAARFIDALNSDRVFTSPEDDLARLTDTVASITLSEINASLTESLASPVRRLGLISARFRHEDELRELWRHEVDVTKARLLPNAPSVPEAPFPYLTIPPSDEPFPELEKKGPYNDNNVLYVGEFKNHIGCVLAPNHEDKERVRLSLVIEGGQRHWAGEELTKLRCAQLILTQGGIGRLSNAATLDLLLPEGISVTENFLDHAIVLSAEGPSAKFTLMLDLLTTLWKDPCLTESARQRAETLLKTEADERTRSVISAMNAYRTAFYTGFNERTVPLLVENLLAYDNATLEETLRHARAEGNVTLIVTGDYDEALTKEVIRTRLAGWDPQWPLGPDEGPADFWDEALGYTLMVEHETTDRVFISVGLNLNTAPTDDLKTRLLRHVTEDYVQECLRVHLRESLGYAYAPEAYYSVLSEPEGFGVAVMEAVVSQEVAWVVLNTMKEFHAQVAKSPITSTELRRVIRPAIERWKVDQKDPGAFHERCVDSVIKGRNMLEEHDAMPEVLKSIQPQEVLHVIQTLSALKARSLTLQKSDKPKDLPKTIN